MLQRENHTSDRGALMQKHHAYRSQLLRLSSRTKSSHPMAPEFTQVAVFAQLLVEHGHRIEVCAWFLTLTCSSMAAPLSRLISYTSEPAVTAAILITSKPVISRDAHTDLTPRRSGGTVACGSEKERKRYRSAKHNKEEVRGRPCIRLLLIKCDE